ncbi:MAG: Fe-S cluster assembly sulfur transfer protein SufU [Gemmatimonadota bacterium]
MTSQDRQTPPLGSLFQEVILDHYKRPRNRGALDEADATVHMNNPTCGDEVVLRLKLEDNAIQDARFEGVGCSISMASTSMMTQLIKGKSAAEAVLLTRRFTEMMHGDEAAARDRQLGDLRALAGVSKFAARVKCALLGWNALEEALREKDSPSE